MRSTPGRARESGCQRSTTAFLLRISSMGIDIELNMAVHNKPVQNGEVNALRTLAESHEFRERRASRETDTEARRARKDCALWASKGETCEVKRIVIVQVVSRRRSGFSPWIRVLDGSPDPPSAAAQPRPSGP